MSNQIFRFSILCFSLVFASMILANFSYGLSVSDDGVVAVWLFDEGSGTTAKDSSGNGNDAKEGTAGITWTAGKFGKALKCAQKGWFETVKPVVVDSVDFTMGAYINPAAKQKTWTNILSSHQEPPRRGVSFEQSGEKANNYSIAIGDGKNWGGAPVVVVKAGEWSQITFVRKGDQGTWYLNGTKGTSKKLESALPVKAATAKFRIGNWVLGGREWNGILDDAFIFERALSADEVSIVSKVGIGAAGTPVDPQDKLSTSWSKIRTIY
jgi:hypothetical protein